MANLNFQQPLLHSSVSQDPSQISDVVFPVTFNQFNTSMLNKT